MQIGAFICRCKGELDTLIDIEFLVEKLKNARSVSWIEVLFQACSSFGLEKIGQTIRDHALTGLVVAACSPQLYYLDFGWLAEASGINRRLVEIANIREQCAWVHPQKEKATRKALDLFLMACARVYTAGATGYLSHKPLHTAIVNRLKCDRCKRCVEECPNEAYHLDKDGFPTPDPQKCQRCGICLGGCPLQAIALPDFRLEEVAAMITAINTAGVPEEEPLLLGFFCKNDAYPEADRLGRERIPYPANLRIIRVPCSGAVNMSLVNDALSHGIDGILIAACRENQCRFKRGNMLVASRIQNLQETLTRMMIEPERVQYLPLAEVTPHVVSIDWGLCNSCFTCREVCPFGAISLKENKKIAHNGLWEVPNLFASDMNELVPVIEPDLCRGCGICAVACRPAAISIEGYTDRDILAQIDGYLPQVKAPPLLGEGILPQFLRRYVEELKTMGPNPFRL
ncbi:MAG: hydrogenase iron-sulfur subunit [Thermoanaerobacteraceae bacterium]|nr:hydrogenase iron-sulfur subunit [Thermoanaerobacteraceae bacterium]